MQGVEIVVEEVASEFYEEDPLVPPVRGVLDDAPAFWRVCTRG